MFKDKIPGYHIKCLLEIVKIHLCPGYDNVIEIFHLLTQVIILLNQSWNFEIDA